MRYSTPSLPGPGLPPVTAKLYEHINFGYSVLSSHIGMGISTSAAVDRVGGVLQGGAGERYHRSREPNFLSCLVLHQGRVFRSAHRVIRDDRAFTLRHILASEILLSKSGSNGGAWDHKADIGNLQPCADDYHVVGHRSRQFCVLADYSVVWASKWSTITGASLRVPGDCDSYKSKTRSRWLSHPPRISPGF